MSEYLASLNLPYRMGAEKAYSTDANVLGARCLDLSGGGGERRQEPGASGADVKRAGGACPDPVRYQRCGVGLELVGGCRRHDH